MREIYSFHNVNFHIRIGTGILTLTRSLGTRIYQLPVYEYDTRVINLFAKAHRENSLLSYYERFGGLAVIHINGLGIA
jgi:16S rRNA A1518/A1519 N6-dimethyltransferase RsmA/KsgA/DIM1 with predicted DNA glycosylase/AP lyase activity